MPFQQVSLDQSVYNKPKSTYSQALTPQRKFLGTQDTSNRFVQEQEAKWAAEDKEMKEQRKQQLLKLQNVGAQAMQKVQQVKLAQEKQQQDMRKKVEENPEPSADELYKFISTLEPDAQQQFLDELFMPIGGGSMSSGGKTIQTEGRYNPIAKTWLKKGYARFDEQGNVSINKAVREFEKGTWSYNDTDNLMVNTATGETVKMSIEGVDGDLIKDSFNYGSTYMGRLTDPTLLEKISPDNMALYMENAKKESQLATMNYLLGQGVDEKTAKDIAYSVPFEKRGKTPEPEPTTGKSAPLDEEKAKGLAEYIKNNPDVDLEAYRERDGDATVDRALELNKPTSTTTTKTTKVTKKEEPTTADKVKDYLSGMKERRGLQ